MTNAERRMDGSREPVSAAMAPLSHKHGVCLFLRALMSPRSDDVHFEAGLGEAVCKGAVVAGGPDGDTTTGLERAL